MFGRDKSKSQSSMASSFDMLSGLQEQMAAIDPGQLNAMMAPLTSQAAFDDITGTAHQELRKTGLLARGLVLDVQKTGTSVGSKEDPWPVCQFSVQVTLDNTPSYNAQFTQALPLAEVPQYVPGQTFIAVRVDPADHSRVVLDPTQPAPTVTISEATTGTPSAASVLESGNPVRAVIIQTQSLNAKNPAGDELYAFVLTILEDGHAPRQTQAGNPVPASCIPLLYPGSNLPAKVSPDNPAMVAIDWPAALAAASQ
jgi:hypothetical protein